MDARIDAKTFVRLNKGEKRKRPKFKEYNDVKHRQTKPLKRMYTK